MIKRILNWLREKRREKVYIEIVEEILNVYAESSVKKEGEK